MSKEPKQMPAAPDGGEPRPAGELSFAALYEQFRSIANRELCRYPGMSVSPTTLVHEAFLNMAGRDGAGFVERAHFLGYVSRAMRGLIIDFARRQQALKRGGGFHITQLTTRTGEEVADGEKLVRLSDALDQLAAHEPRLAEVVDLKYFCGFSFCEIAGMRGTSERTVRRDWEKARLLLFKQLDESDF